VDPGYCCDNQSRSGRQAAEVGVVMVAASVLLKRSALIPVLVTGIQPRRACAMANVCRLPNSPTLTDLGALDTCDEHRNEGVSGNICTPRRRPERRARGKTRICRAVAPLIRLPAPSPRWGEETRGEVSSSLQRLPPQFWQDRRHLPLLPGGERQGIGEAIGSQGDKHPERTARGTGRAEVDTP
jgi:tRNA(Ile)-lysidine synthase